MKYRVSTELAARIDSAGPNELRALIAFFDAPFLRLQYEPLLVRARGQLAQLERFCSPTCEGHQATPRVDGSLIGPLRCSVCGKLWRR